MITLQHVIKAIAVALTLLVLPGCTSMELAVDLYKKQTREAGKMRLWWRRRATRLATPTKVVFGITQNAICV